MTSDALERFVARARALGLADEAIADLAHDAGWSEAPVRIALADLEARTPSAPPTQPAHATQPVPLPQPTAAPRSEAEQPGDDAADRASRRPSISPPVAAIHHVALWFFTGTATPLIPVVLGAIRRGDDDAPTTIARFTAVLAIAGALYGVLLVVYLRRALHPPYPTANRVWSTITICIHMIGAVTALTFATVYLVEQLSEAPDGSAPPGAWIGWSLLVALVHAAITVLYLTATFLGPRMRGRRAVLIGAPVVVLAVLVGVLAYSLAALPGVRHDVAVRADVAETAVAVGEFAAAHGRLPDDAEFHDLDTPDGVDYEADGPRSGIPTSEHRYELCAEFERESHSGRTEASIPVEPIDDAYRVTVSELGEHGAGRSCFHFTNTLRA